MNDLNRRPEVRVNRTNLKFAYKMRGFTSYQQLATLAGVSKGTIGNLMTKRNTCNPETAAAIAKALGVAPDELFTLKLCTGAASVRAA